MTNIKFRTHSSSFLSASSHLSHGYETVFLFFFEVGGGGGGGEGGGGGKKKGGGRGYSIPNSSAKSNSKINTR